MIIGINATGSAIQYGYFSEHGSQIITLNQTKQVERLPDLVIGMIDSVSFQPSKVVSLTGPGSYTGIRIGLTVAKMLGKIYQIPVMGCSLFDAFMIAQSSFIHELTVLTSNSRKGFVNLQLFQSNDGSYQSISSILQLNYQQLSNFLAKFDQPVSWVHLNDPIPSDVSFPIQCLSMDFPIQQLLSNIPSNEGHDFSDLSLIYSSTVF